MMPNKTRKKSHRNNGEPLTWNTLVDFAHEILFPAMDERFATKHELNKFKGEMYEFRDEMYRFKKEMCEFRDESLTRQDAILNKLDILIQEKKVADYQHEKERQFFLIITKALKDSKILTQSQLKKISELEIF